MVKAQPVLSLFGCEPGAETRADALIGAIVMDDLDLIVDGAAQKVRYRDPDGLLSEIEAFA
ncbi:MAG: hypothetical protein NVSMB14_17330 [Isosphaeraceae bacterium]